MPLLATVLLAAIVGILIGFWPSLPGPNASKKRVLPSRDTALTVESKPAGAQLWVDDESRGTTPVTIDSIAAGTHEIRAQHEDYVIHTQTVEIKTGEKMRVQITMIPVFPAASPSHR